MIHRRTVLTTLGAALALTTLTKRAHAQSTPDTAEKETIAILGTGNMGRVLGKRWGKNGHPIAYGSRTPGDERVKTLVKDSGPRASAQSPKEAVAKADFVVFALPWNAVKDMVPTLGDLSGKIVIDPMNALKMVNGYPVAADMPTSVAEQLQEWLPGAHVVKAFNTPAARSIVDPGRVGGTMTIGLAGTNTAAKARVAGLVSELGLEPLDVGPLAAALYLEAMMRLSFGYLLYTKGKSFEFYFPPVMK